MAVIRMADDGIAFDGGTLSRGPLGGAETAFISLAEALAARGHDVTIHNHCVASMKRHDVVWEPLQKGVQTTDLYIANRGDRLIHLVPDARARVLDSQPSPVPEQVALLAENGTVAPHCGVFIGVSRAIDRSVDAYGR